MLHDKHYVHMPFGDLYFVATAPTNRTNVPLTEFQFRDSAGVYNAVDNFTGSITAGTLTGSAAKPLFNDIDGSGTFTLQATNKLLENVPLQFYNAVAKEISSVAMAPNGAVNGPYDEQMLIIPEPIMEAGRTLAYNAQQPSITFSQPTLQFVQTTHEFYDNDVNSEYSNLGTVYRRAGVRGPHPNYNALDAVSRTWKAFAPILIISRRPGLPAVYDFSGSGDYSICLPSEEADPITQDRTELYNAATEGTGKYYMNDTDTSDPGYKSLVNMTIATTNPTSNATISSDGSTNWYHVWGYQSGTSGAAPTRGLQPVAPELQSASMWTGKNISGFSQRVTNGFGKTSNNSLDWSSLTTQVGNDNKSDAGEFTNSDGVTVYVAFNPLSRSVILPTLTADLPAALKSIISVEKASTHSTSLAWATSSWGRTSAHSATSIADQEGAHGFWKANYWPVGTFKIPRLHQNATHTTEGSSAETSTDGTATEDDTSLNGTNYIVLEWNRFDASQPADNLRNLYKIVYRPNGAVS